MTFKDILGSLKKAKDETTSYLDRDKTKTGFQFTSPTSKIGKAARITGAFGKYAKKELTTGDDPGQYGLSRLFAGQVANTQSLFTPMIGKEKADKLAFGIRGASQLTPFNLSKSQKTKDIYRGSAPVTEQQKQAQSVGRSLYGYALTAPIGGANKLVNTVGRAATSTGFGAGIGAGIAKLTGGDVKQGARQGAYQGFKQGPLLAVTNPLTNKLVNAVSPGASLLTQQIAKRGIGGAANLIEDEILAKIDGLQTTRDQKYQSIIFGAIMTGNDQAFKALGGQLMQAGVPINKIRPLVNSVVEKSADLKRKFMIPVQTLEQNPKTGEFIKKPMWQVSLGQKVDKAKQAYKDSPLSSESGFVDFGVLAGKNKQEPKPGIFGDVSTKENEMLLRLMEQRKPTGYEGVVADLKSTLQTRKPEFEQPGYIKSLMETGEQPTFKTPDTRIKPQVAPQLSTKPQEIDISSTLKNFKEKGIPEVRTQKDLKASVQHHTPLLMSKHRDMTNLAIEVSNQGLTQNVYDVIRKGEKPKNRLVEQLVEKIKIWRKDLADIGSLESSGKLKQDYIPAYSNEQMFKKELSDSLLGDGFLDSMYDLPHLKRQTNKNFIGDGANLEDILNYRTRLAVLDSHSGVVMDTPMAKVAQKYKKYATEVIDSIKNDSKKDIEQFDLVGEMQKLTDVKKKVTTKTLSLMGKTVGTTDSVFVRIGKNGGEDLHKAYRNIRDIDIFQRKLFDKLKTAEPEQVIEFLNKKFDAQLNPTLFKNLQDKYGMSHEDAIKFVLKKQLDSKLTEDFIQQIGKHEFSNPVIQNAVNVFANNLLMKPEMEKGLLNATGRFITNTVASAHLGLSTTVSAKQPLEAIKAPIYAGFTNTFKGTARAFDPFGGKNKQLVKDLDLKQIGLDQRPVNKGKFKQIADLKDKALFYPMQKAEYFKNRVFAFSMDEALKKGDQSEIKKLQKIRDVLYSGGNIAAKYNKPNILLGSKQDSKMLGDALGMYLQFGIKNIDLKLSAAENKEWKQLGKLLLSDMVTTAATMSIFGYSADYAIKNLLPPETVVLADVFTKIYDNFQQYGQDIESGSEKGQVGSKYRLKKSLVQNFAPAGTQIMRMKEGFDILKQGADISPSGYKRYEAPTDPIEKAKLMAFGKSSTKANSQYMDELKESGWKPDPTKYDLEGVKSAAKGAYALLKSPFDNKASAVEETGIDYTSLNQEQFDEVYGKAKGVVKQFENKKILIQNDPTLSKIEKENELKTLQESYNSYKTQLDSLEKGSPDKVMTADIEFYNSSHGDIKVPQRAAWAKEQIEKIPETERNAFIQRLIDEKVLTTGSSGTIKELEKLGIDLDDYDVNVLGTGNVKIGKVKKVTGGARLKFATPKGVSAPSFAKVKLGTTKKAPKISLPSVRIKSSDTSALSRSKKLTKGFKVKKIKPKLAKLSF